MPGPDECRVRIVALDHADLAVAQQIHAIQALAHAQEARLLKVSAFSPFGRTIESLRSSKECHLGAIEDEALVGVLSFEPDSEPGQVLITSLVVHPGHQRKGHARALMAELFRLGEKEVFAVCTAAGNAPALSLYRSLGFSEYRFGTLGAEALPLLKLRRPCPGLPSGQQRPAVPGGRGEEDRH